MRHLRSHPTEAWLYGHAVAESVRPLDLGVVWEPNAPLAVLLADDAGTAVLALGAHPDDDDERCVVIVWTGTHAASLSEPNDEAISGHRLYDKGLADVLWAGIVEQSAAIADLERQNRVHPNHDASRFRHVAHHVLPLKERVVEVIAEAVEVRRIEGTTVSAAASALRR